MKHLTKLISFACCAMLLGSGNVTAQVAPAKLKKNVTLSKDKISPKKLNKWDIKLQQIEFKGEYVVFESDLFKAYQLGIKSSKSENKKMLRATTGTKKVMLKSSADMNQISNPAANTQQTSVQSGYILGGSDCGTQITPDLCKRIKNAMRIEMIEDEEVPRDCPDEHCLPIKMHKNLKYIILPKNIKEFAATFYDLKGNKVGSTGNPVAISSDTNYRAFPIELQSNVEDMRVKIVTISGDHKNVYTAAVKMKEF